MLVCGLKGDRRWSGFLLLALLYVLSPPPRGLLKPGGFFKKRLFSILYRAGHILDWARAVPESGKNS